MNSFKICTGKRISQLCEKIFFVHVTCMLRSSALDNRFCDTIFSFVSLESRLPILQSRRDLVEIREPSGQYYLSQTVFVFDLVLLLQVKFKRLFVRKVCTAQWALVGLLVGVRCLVPFKVSQMIISFTTNFAFVQIVAHVQPFVLSKRGF